MTEIQKHYQETVVPALMKEFGITNAFAVPRLRKVVINVGVTQPQDPRARKQILENVRDQIKVITGQQPVITKASKSIASFKLRAGDPLGVKVTLRGTYMWEFLQKLISVALPRVKDFRGVSSKSFDGTGTYSLGIEEQIIFPEIEYDKIDSIRGLQVIMVTTTESDEQSRRMFALLGMPFEKKDN
jgi:large subunit ribosomal protein L5